MEWGEGPSQNRRSMWNEILKTDANKTYYRIYKNPYVKSIFFHHYPFYENFIHTCKMFQYIIP